MDNHAFVKFGLTSPPEDGSEFDRWQAEVDLVMLKRLETVEVRLKCVEGHCEKFVMMGRSAKVAVAICVFCASMAAAAAAVAGLFLR